jgi:hypothetical protein
MFVTSDVHNMRAIGLNDRIDWREHLLCGVAVHASSPVGIERLAGFLFEAAKRCGLVQSMEYAGYTPMGGKRSRPIAPASFERLVNGKLRGALGARGALLRGTTPADGTHRGDILFGGEGGLSPRRVLSPTPPYEVTSCQPVWLSADFLFPLTDQPIERACELFEIAADLLDAEYGYFFVRDEHAFPSGYAYGISAPLDRLLTNPEKREIGQWSRFKSCELWSAPWPLLRDLYQINLLSARHLQVSAPGIGDLAEWIGARPGRGRLEDIGQGRALWTLTDAEMFNLRPLLHRAGLLVSCVDRVYRDLSPAAIATAGRSQEAL